MKTHNQLDSTGRIIKVTDALNRTATQNLCALSEKHLLPEKNIASLKQLISERDMYMSDKSKYQGQITDQKRFMSRSDYAQKRKRLERQIKELEQSIAEIEREIERLIREDAVLSRQRDLLVSIDGVGEKTALKVIVETGAFRDFKNARHSVPDTESPLFSGDCGSSPQ